MKTEEAYLKAIDVLKKCSSVNGLYASGVENGYDAVWARDSMISLIGGSLSKEYGEEFKKVFERSLNTLAKHQSEHGQIPNAVDKWSKRKPHVDFLSIDSSLWFIFGSYIFSKRYGEELRNSKAVKKTFEWLECQDSAEKGIIVQLPTTDWQDAFPHKYGNTINTQAIYYGLLNLVGKKKDAGKLKKMINEDKDWGLWNGKYYWAYRWKNHNKYKEIGDWFDSLGNLLAVIFDLADEKQSLKILKYIKDKKINKPYPVKAIYPSIKRGSKYWQDYYLDCDAGKPNHYLNGGVWPFIGGFYVLALVKMKKFKEARLELEKLAESLLNWNFPEWINPVNKKNYGGLQAWDAGVYIWAYECVVEEKVRV